MGSSDGGRLQAQVDGVRSRRVRQREGDQGVTGTKEVLEERRHLVSSVIALEVPEAEYNNTGATRRSE